MIVDGLNGAHEEEHFGHPHLFRQPCVPISLREKLSWKFATSANGHPQIAHDR